MLLYLGVLWVAVLRTALAPYPADLIDEVVQLVAPHPSSNARASKASPGRYARFNADGSPADEDRLADGDAAEDDDFFVEPCATGSTELPRVHGRPHDRLVIAPRTFPDRVDRPPRALRA